MSGIATSDTICSGQGKLPPRPVAETVAWFTVNGKPVVMDGAMFPDYNNRGSTHSGAAISSNSWFQIGARALSVKAIPCHVAPLSQRVKVG